MSRIERKFKNKQEIKDWLEGLLEDTAKIFEKEFQVDIEKLGTDSDYQRQFPYEERVFKYIKMVFNKLENHYSPITLNTVGRRNKDIWSSYTFQSLAKSIIDTLEYDRLTKDSTRPNSKTHIERKNYILNAPSDHWSTPDFKEIFYWVVENIVISTSLKRTSPKKENEYKYWWVAVQCLNRAGVLITKAQELVAYEYDTNPSGNDTRDISRQYRKVKNSDWAKGEGVLWVDAIYFSLINKEIEVNVLNIEKEIKIRESKITSHSPFST